MNPLSQHLDLCVVGGGINGAGLRAAIVSIFLDDLKGKWQDSELWAADFAHVDTTVGEARRKAREYITSTDCPTQFRATKITDPKKKEEAFTERVLARQKLGWPYPGEP